MGFIRLKALLDERAKEKPPLQDAVVLSRIKKVWRKEGKNLFNPTVQEHIMETVEPQRLKQGTLTISAFDTHAMSATLLIRNQLLTLFQQAVPEAKITEIRLKRAQKRTIR